MTIKKNNEDSSPPNNGKNEVLRLILKEYYRIYRESILRDKSSISKEIVTKIFDILAKIIAEEENKDLLEIFFGTTAIGENYNEFNYYEFMKLAVENKDNSRFKLVRLIISLIKSTLLIRQQMDEEILNQILTSTLFQINRLIIDNDDLELFKEQINAFSMSVIIESPVKIQEEIINNLYEAENELNIYCSEIHEQADTIRFLVKYKLSRDFNLWRPLSDKITDFESDIMAEIKLNDEENFEESKNKLIEIFEGSTKIRRFGIQRELYEFFISALIYRTFFMVGAYIIFKNNKNSVLGSDYIKELWMHTSPEDQITTMLNNTPVEFDGFWLIVLYLFGGINNEIWVDLLDYRLENFHELDSYMVQYFILNLIKSYNSSKNIFTCNKNQIHEINECYDFISRILYRKNDLNKNIDILINNNKEWSNLLKQSNSLKNIESTLKITVIDEDRILDMAKKFIDELFEKLNQTNSSFELLLPLDESKTSNAQEKMLKWYFQYSKLPELFECQTYDEKSSELDYIKIAFRPIYPKNYFIKTSNVLSDALWDDISRKIVFGEENYCLKTILSSKKNIKELKASNLIGIYETIKSMVNSLLNKNLKPDILFIPLDVLIDIRSENVNAESPLFKKLDKNEFLNVGENTRLKIFHSNNLVDFDEIIVMDTHSVDWSYKQDYRNNKRLWVDIKIFEEEPSNVEVYVRTKLNLNVTNQDGIEIIRLIGK